MPAKKTVTFKPSFFQVKRKGELDLKGAADFGRSTLVVARGELQPSLKKIWAYGKSWQTAYRRPAPNGGSMKVNTLSLARRVVVLFFLMFGAASVASVVGISFGTAHAENGSSGGG
jgi:hypothetical protein